jgi:alkanesulfonate monooxygenase SsuD/methylene tetrahydromethanopterin reductase-like flavin-dependent oxidoreductase (luciferase family)
VPVVVGGRAPAALRRAGRLGDGWLGVFVDPARFGASVETVEKSAADAGRHEVTWDHGVLVWCAFGPTAEAARPALADAMQNLYQQPFERFERYAPHGTPEDVAAALVPYADAGAKHVLLAAVGADPLECVTGAARVRHLLRRTA